jgi:hypothetical protein
MLMDIKDETQSVDIIDITIQEKTHKDPPLGMLQLPIARLAKSNCTRTALGSQLAGSEPLNLESERRVFAFVSVALRFQDFVALSSAAESIC